MVIKCMCKWLKPALYSTSSGHMNIQALEVLTLTRAEMEERMYGDIPRNWSMSITTSLVNNKKRNNGDIFCRRKSMWAADVNLGMRLHIVKATREILSN